MSKKTLFKNAILSILIFPLGSTSLNAETPIKIVGKENIVIQNGQVNVTPNNSYKHNKNITKDLNNGVVLTSKKAYVSSDNGVAFVERKQSKLSYSTYVYHCDMHNKFRNQFTQEERKLLKDLSFKPFFDLRNEVIQINLLNNERLTLDNKTAGEYIYSNTTKLKNPKTKSSKNSKDFIKFLKIEKIYANDKQVLNMFNVDKRELIVEGKWIKNNVVKQFKQSCYPNGIKNNKLETSLP